MMSQQIGFSILTAPLAAIDRRTLSQAWYSALHLAKEPPADVPAPRCMNQIPDEAARSALAMPRRVATSAESSAPTRSLSSKSPDRTHAIAPERRALRSTLARKIERAFLHPSTPPTRATFSIGATRERVHIALQVHGRRVRLVAICAPRVRARVARALAQARYALAQRGVALDLHGEMLQC